VVDRIRAESIALAKEQIADVRATRAQLAEERLRRLGSLALA